MTWTKRFYAFGHFFIAGVLFAPLYFLVLALLVPDTSMIDIQKADEAREKKRASYKYHTFNLPPETYLSDHQILMGEEKLTIVVNFKNVSEFHLNHARFNAHVDLGTAMVENCSGLVHGIEKNAIAQIEIVCKRVEGMRIPDNLNYQITGDGGYRLKDQEPENAEAI